MKKSELKQVLSLYPEIEQALLDKNETAEIKRNRRIERMKLNSWMYKLPEIIRVVRQNAQGTLVGSVIEENICKGKKDQKVLQRIPVSESTYYRWKRRIIDKIYELYILSNDVTEEEILSERIE